MLTQQQWYDEWMEVMGSASCEDRAQQGEKEILIERLKGKGMWLFGGSGKKNRQHPTLNLNLGTLSKRG